MPGQVDSTGVAGTFPARLQHGFAQLGDYVVPLLGAAVIVFTGYLVAALLERLTLRLLRRVRLNTLLERGGVMEAVDRSGVHFDPTRVIALIVFWLTMFAVLLVAGVAVGLDSLATVFSQLVGYLPSVIAALVIIVVGIVLGAFVGGLIMAAGGGVWGGPWLARVGRGGILVLAIFMALQELGVATEIVTTAFAILFGAVALALALAFGLGNRELAGEVTRAWYDRYRAERDAIAAEVAARAAADAAADVVEPSK
jgi:hypothetical protein